MDGTWRELLCELKLRDRTVNPETLHLMKAYRPELFGDPSPLVKYSVRKVARGGSKRRVFTLSETLATEHEGGSPSTLRYGTLFEEALEEIARRYPGVDSKEVFEVTDEGMYAESIFRLLSGWADSGNKLSVLDILKGANIIGFPMQLDYSDHETGEHLSGNIISLEYAIFYPLLFAAVILGGVRVGRCRLCGKLFIEIDPNRRYCQRIGEEMCFPNLSCEGARKRIASQDSNLRRAVERKIKKIRERLEETGPSEEFSLFERRLEEKRCELKGNPRRNEELLKWLEWIDADPERVERFVGLFERCNEGDKPYAE